MNKFRTLELATEYYQLGARVKLPAPLKDQFLRSASSRVIPLACDFCCVGLISKILK